MPYQLPVPRPGDARQRRKFYKREWRRAMRRHGRWPVKAQGVVPAEKGTPQSTAGEEPRT